MSVSTKKQTKLCNIKYYLNMSKLTFKEVQQFKNNKI